MIRQTIKKGFTLIELLVVITIIGILAVGGVSVYTSQIEQARDSTRVTDSTTLKGAIQEYNLANAEFPSNANIGALTGFIAEVPGDPKSGKECILNTPCDYLYRAGNLTSTNSSFELSIGFENQKSVDAYSKDTKDNGNDPKRFEIGNEKTLDTSEGASGANTATVGTGKKCGNPIGAVTVITKLCANN